MLGEYIKDAQIDIKLSRGSTPNIRGMLSPAMFDSIFDIETFLCPAAMSYQGLPGATRSHQESPRATKGHQKPAGLTKSHQEPPRPPAATRSHWRHQERHQESLGAARSHKEPPGLTEEPPGATRAFSRHSSTRSYFHKNLSKACGPWAKTVVKLHVLPSPGLKLQ